jgi:arylsulfatase
MRGRSHTSQQLLTSMDVMPTILDLAGSLSSYGTLRDGARLSVTVVSFAPLLGDPQRRVRAQDATIAFELHGHRAVYRDNWKLVWLGREQGGHFDEYVPPSHWELFDLSADPAESLDVSPLHPDVVASLSSAWDRYAREVGVVVQ